MFSEENTIPFILHYEKPLSWYYLFIILFFYASKHVTRWSIKKLWIQLNVITNIKKVNVTDYC